MRNFHGPLIAWLQNNVPFLHDGNIGYLVAPFAGFGMAMLGSPSLGFIYRYLCLCRWVFCTTLFLM